MQTQTSNTLHNAIMEADGKDRLLMLAPDNYVLWKSRIKRYIDTKPNHELIYYCLKNPPYKLTWSDKEVPISEGSCVTTTETYMETYKNVSQDIRDQLNAEAEEVQIILTGIDNDIYSTVDACLNACEMWKAIERSQQAATRNRGKAIVNSPPPIYDQEPSMVAEDDEMSKDKKIDKLMALIFYRSRKSTNLPTTTFELHQTPVEQIRIILQGLTEALGVIIKADWRDDTDDELEDQELEVHYMYMAKIQEVSPDAADSGPIFDAEPLQKIDQNDADNDLANECELLASLIKKLKCEIDDSKNRNKFLETSNKVLVEKLKGEIEDFKNKNKSLESSNNRFKEANNKLSETNKLLYDDFKKSQTELDRRNNVEYASKMEINCAKAKGDLISYKMESQKSFNKYTETINDLNQTILEMNKKLCAHQETISILSQVKKAQIKLYKTREDKELDKVIALENKVKVLDNIVYKTGQSVQTINMLNTNFGPEIRKINADLEKFHLCLNEEMVVDLRYFNSLELEVDSLRSQLKTQKTQFLNEIDRISREYYYADHMNAILSVYTELDEVTNLQCDYLELLEKCECLEKELSKSKMMSKSFETLQKHAVNVEIDLQQCKEKIKNDKSFYENQSKDFCKEREQY
nr:hypothetical protein [Tanacetum cinerariifolium]